MVTPSSPGVQMPATNDRYVPSVQHGTNGSTLVGAPVNGVGVSVEDERDRLEAEVAAARQTLAAAKRRAAERDLASNNAIRAEVEASRDALADVERRHHDSVIEVRESAAAEVERILTDAHRRAAEIVELRPSSIPPSEPDVE